MESSWLQVFLSWLPLIIYAALFVFCTYKVISPIRRSSELIGEHNELMRRHLENEERIAIAIEKLSDK